MLLNLLVTQAVNATADGKPHLHAFFCFSPLTLWCSPTPLLSLPRGLLQFRSFGVMTVLLMFSSLHPSFFPSIMFFLAILIVILLISSQEIQANRWNAGHLSRNVKVWVGKTLVLLDLEKRWCLTGWAHHWPHPAGIALLPLAVCCTFQKTS